MSMLHRKTGDLRHGRISIPGATYFVTTCTAGRRNALASFEAASYACRVVQRMVQDRDFGWTAATVMRDHVHILFELGSRLPIDGCVAKIKGLITRTLHPGTSLWQENAFEHRLRDEENAEDYAFYVFMNPYRAGLVTIDEAWPWWVCSDPKRLRFLDSLRADGAPPTEWLNRDDTAGGTIVVGE